RQFASSHFCRGLILNFINSKSFRVASTLAFTLCVLLNANAVAQNRRHRNPLRKPDVIFVPTPEETVEEMLRLAEIKPGDKLYDLGSGDGRIPIRAAQKYGIHAVGIDIDPKMISIAEEAARAAGVADKVKFRNEDLFRADFRDATV